jgi:nucleotide-binding universal stress UspA family protein
MYQHILVATDGSALSRKAVKAAVQLAAGIGARLTGIYVMPEYQPAVYGEAAMYFGQLSPRKFREAAEQEAVAALAVVQKAADDLDLSAGATRVTSAQPWDAIIKVARKKKCDLIVMASHGRRGLKGLLLGSQTVKVLTHSKVPVLVCR